MDKSIYSSIIFLSLEYMKVVGIADKSTLAFFLKYSIP